MERAASLRFSTRRRAFLGVGAALLAVPLACNSVLGLDAPTLDPCAETACADGGASDAANDADARARDTGPTVGLRCGGGMFAATGCTGATATCCQLTDDAGTTYECRASAAACPGYPIACTSNADCPGNDVCCHSATQIKCVGSTACANDSLVCEPGGMADQCPAGWSCTAQVTNAGVASPYFGCAP